MHVEHNVDNIPGFLFFCENPLNFLKILCYIFFYQILCFLIVAVMGKLIKIRKVNLEA